MKITKFVTILLIIPCLISCYGNKSSKTTQSNNADYDIRLNDSIAAVNAMLEEGNADGEKINAFLDAYMSKHPNCFKLKVPKIKDINILYPLPVAAFKKPESIIFLSEL